MPASASIVVHLIIITLNKLCNTVSKKLACKCKHLTHSRLLEQRKTQGSHYHQGDGTVCKGDYALRAEYWYQYRSRQN